MKTLTQWIIILAAFYCLLSCDDRNVLTQQTDFEIKGITLQNYNIDSCEYIGRVNGANTDFLTHKGNCKNHKPKP